MPVCATLVGGWLAVRFRRWLHILLAIGAGLLLGAAFADLLPEAIAIGTGAGFAVSRTLTWTLGSFLVFFIIENLLDGFAKADGQLSIRSRGRMAGGMLIFHSFRDGMAIGAAFTASHKAGYAVALGIATHDLGDGMNAMLLTTAGGKPGRVDYAFLVADAVAPFAGGLAAIWWFSTAASTVALLAIAAGFFIQMAASDFLPQVRRSSAPRLHVIACVLGGVGLIYAANLLLGF